jgi:signal transduction histidine kinase
LTKIKLGSLLSQVSICGLTEPLTEIIGMIDQSIQQTRSLMRELSPSVLYELGFTAAIEWLSEQIQGQHGLQISLINDIKTLKIDKEVQLLLFRAVRELLLNVVKHARAKEAYISLQKSGSNIVVKVRDNGVGFDISQTGQISKQTGGFGLISIQERIKYIGGHFEIKTGKGHGASITLIAPLKSRKKILGG